MQLFIGYRADFKPKIWRGGEMINFAKLNNFRPQKLDKRRKIANFVKRSR